MARIAIPQILVINRCSNPLYQGIYTPSEYGVLRSTNLIQKCFLEEFDVKEEVPYEIVLYPTDIINNMKKQ